MVTVKIIIQMAEFSKEVLWMEFPMVMVDLSCQMETTIKAKSSLVELMVLELTKLILLHTKVISKTMFDMVKDKRKVKAIFFLVNISMGKKNQDCINIMETCLKDSF